MARWMSDLGAMTSRTTWPHALARVLANSGFGSDTATVSPSPSRTRGTARWPRETLSGMSSMASGVGVCWDRSTSGTWSCVDRALARSRSSMAPSSTRTLPIRLPEVDCCSSACASWSLLTSCALDQKLPELGTRAREVASKWCLGRAPVGTRGGGVLAAGILTQLHPHSHQWTPVQQEVVRVAGRRRRPRSCTPSLNSSGCLQRPEQGLSNRFGRIPDTPRSRGNAPRTVTPGDCVNAGSPPSLWDLNKRSTAQVGGGPGRDSPSRNT